MSWYTAAACADNSVPAEAWTVRDGIMWGKGPMNRLAIRICNRCPVAAECLDEAMTMEGPGRVGNGRDIREGIWGGYTPHQRHLLRERAGVR